MTAPEYFNGPFLKNNIINYRHYQKNILNRCKNKNSLVVLPTGLGKTIIAILLVAQSLDKYSKKAKVLILAPTRPLISQHEGSCKKFLNVNEDMISALTGKITPERRIQMFHDSSIIISTPQVIKNDLERGRYDLKRVSLLIFDEAHRTKGNYAYNFISSEYLTGGCSDPLILGLTASPGKDYEHVQQICDNLFIENIVFKTREDNDVKEYIHDIDLFVEKVELSISILELGAIWDHLLNKFLRFFIDRGLINPAKNYFSKLDFLRISKDLTLSLRYENGNLIDITDDEYLSQLSFKSPPIIDIVKRKKLNIQSIFSYCSSCISILHAKDLLETQNITLFKTFLDKLNYKAEQDILSSKRIVCSKHFELIQSLIEKEGTSKLAHPKINRLISIIKEEIEEYHNQKVIIFTQYREMAEFLKNKLIEVFSKQLSIEKFIGQSMKMDDMGYSQRKQIEILDDFREDKIDILIATSVAEEGLDIPNVDSIIFYEPIPSEIRLIQRRGRTGRFAEGRCYILIADGTVDVPFHKVALRKEDTMNDILLNPEQLSLVDNISRKEIDFSSLKTSYSGLDYLRNFKERREKEKEFLANRSIEEIISELDNFKLSDQYKRLKECGVSFYSDIVKIDKSKLKQNMLKLKGKKKKMTENKRKKYINNNVKTLINIAMLYSENGTLELSRFKELASEEDIIEKKFYAHYNQACYLGYLKKAGNHVQFIKELE